MAYDRRQLAAELRRQLAHGFDPIRLARWARSAGLTHRRDATGDTRLFIRKVGSMDEGPEFQLTEAEFLQLLADLEATPDSDRR